METNKYYFIHVIIMARRKKVSKTEFLRIPKMLARNTSPTATLLKRKLFGAKRAEKQTKEAVAKFGKLKSPPTSLKRLL
ncbi:hypothetical protein LCGC14_0700220 [marine sediment metagenome]|uniref:Uncharacterized protein n=1 Tax=marine sediment metagenome TaxID=412755 RepID=A0A0F9QI07_9ZZZZ